MKKANLEIYSHQFNKYSQFDTAYPSGIESILTLKKSDELLNIEDAMEKSSCTISDLGSYDCSDISNSDLGKFKVELPIHIFATCEQLGIEYATVQHIHQEHGEWLNNIPVYKVKSDSISSLCQPIVDLKPKAVIYIEPLQTINSSFYGEANIFGYYLLDIRNLVIGMVLIYIKISIYECVEDISEAFEEGFHTEDDYELKKLMENNFQKIFFNFLRKKDPKYFAENYQN